MTKLRIFGNRPSEIVERAFDFFDENQISADQLAERLQSEFQEAYCLSVNDEDEKKNYQMQVNTLEDKNNPIRAIFAVQKLNEGWDVLNLFDIVRCYEAHDSGKGTESEKRQSLKHNLSGAVPVIFLLYCQINQTGSAESLMRNATMNCAC